LYFAMTCYDVLGDSLVGIYGPSHFPFIPWFYWCGFPDVTDFSYSRFCVGFNKW